MEVGPAGGPARLRNLLLRNGLLTAGIYGALAVSFPLAGHWNRLLDWHQLTGSSVPRFFFTAAAGLALFLLYAQTWRACHEAGAIGAHRLILIFGALFSLILVSMYPVSSNDVYTYFLYGRIYAFYDQSPFVAAAGRLAADPLNGFITPWVDVPSPYGPLWTLLSGLASWIVGVRLLWGLLFFKLLAALAVILAALLLDQLLRRTAPAQRDAGLVLFFWNPLLLFESSANGHNDAVVLLLALLAFWLIATQRAVVASAATFALSLLMKPSALLWAPLYVLLLLASASGEQWRPLARRLLLGAGLGLILATAAYAPFGGLVYASQGVLAQGELYSISIAAALRSLLATAGINDSAHLAVGGLVSLFLVGYAWALWRAPRDWPSLAAVGSGAYFILLALVWPQFHPWYVLWPLALAPFVKDEVWTVRLMLFSALALLGFSFGHAWPWEVATLEAAPGPLVALLVFLPPLLLPGGWLRRVVRHPETALHAA